jgi:lipoate-protein ligase A
MDWEIISTPAMSGEENMEYDRRTLNQVAHNGARATLRFFRWARPTVSFGRLQRIDRIKNLVPKGWETVQRPTGGGIVFHKEDLCLSLCWPQGHPPLPLKATAQYEWIHRVVLEALGDLQSLRLVNCKDSFSPDAPGQIASGDQYGQPLHSQSVRAPFENRQCFQSPVGFDVLSGDQKIVGGALARQRGVTLYQGSIQTISADLAEPLLTAAFDHRLASVHV